MPQETAAVIGHSGSLQHRVLQNVAGMLSGRVVGLCLSAASSVILARYLGSVGLGEYAALYAYVSLFGWLGSFGIDQILVRETVRRRAEAGSILITGTVVGLIFASFTTLLVLLIAPSVGYTGQLRWLLVPVALDSLILGPVKYPGLVFYADIRQWYSVSIGLVRQIVWLAVIVVCALLHVSLTWMIVGRAFCALVETILTLSLSFRFLAGPWRFLFGEVGTLLVHSAPIALGILASGIYYRIDQVLLHKIVSDQVLGQYVAAVNLTEVFTALPIAVMASVFPILAQSADDRQRFDRCLGISYRSLMTTIFGICAVASPLVKPLVGTVYGARFAGAAPSLAVLIWSEVGIFFCTILAGALVARNLQAYIPVWTVAGAVSNLGLNLVLIPRLGAVGAAWATLISYSLGIFPLLLFEKTRSLTWAGIRIALRPCFLALFVALVLSLLTLRPLFAFSLGSFLYLAGTVLLGTVRKSDLEMLWAMVRGTVAYARKS